MCSPEINIEKYYGSIWYTLTNNWILLRFFTDGKAKKAPAARKPRAPKSPAGKEKEKGVRGKKKKNPWSDSSEEELSDFGSDEDMDLDGSFTAPVAKREVGGRRAAGLYILHTFLRILLIYVLPYYSRVQMFCLCNAPIDNISLFS